MPSSSSKPYHCAVPTFLTFFEYMDEVVAMIVDVVAFPNTRDSTLFDLVVASGIPYTDLRGTGRLPINLKNGLYLITDGLRQVDFDYFNGYIVRSQKSLEPVPGYYCPWVRSTPTGGQSYTICPILSDIDVQVYLETKKPVVSIPKKVYHNLPVPSAQYQAAVARWCDFDGED